MAIISKALKIYKDCDPVTMFLGTYANKIIKHVHKYFWEMFLSFLFTMLGYEKFFEYSMVRELINKVIIMGILR